MDNYFKPAGNIEEQQQSYFKPAGNLQKEEEKGNQYFQPASDLEKEEVKENSYFQPAENIESHQQIGNIKNGGVEINEYLKSIVTGKRTPPEFGHFPVAGGQKLVSLEELKEMVSRGDNIIKAEYFEEMGKIIIEFESFNLEETSKKHR